MTDFPFVMDHLHGYGLGGPYPAGTVISITWGSSHVDSPCGTYGYAVLAGSDVESLGESHYAADGAGHTYSATLTSDAAWVKWGGFTDGFCSTGTLFDVTGSPSPPGMHCIYGVQPNPDASPTMLVTFGLIDTVVAGVLAGTANVEWIPFVETALAALEGSVYIAVDCSTLPQGNNTLDLSNPGTYSFANLQSWFQNAAWHFFCQCVPAPPGEPPAIPPDPPTIIPPTGVSPVQPPFVCDNTDLCGFLTKIKEEIDTVLAQLRLARLDIQLIQRQGVPFGYVHGAVHSGLTGSGDFDVADILGLEVAFTTLPPLATHSTTDPDTYHQLGKVSLGTVDGWRRSWQPTHNPYLIFPVSGAFTRVGYTFAPGAVVTITELLREP